MGEIWVNRLVVLLWRRTVSLKYRPTLGRKRTPAALKSQVLLNRAPLLVVLRLLSRGGVRLVFLYVHGSYDTEMGEYFKSLDRRA